MKSKRKFELFYKLHEGERFSSKLDELIALTPTAPISYKVYSIPKKKGGRRTIAHPTKKLKEIQKKLLELLQLQIHKSAYAYRKGRNIAQNAETHKENKFLLKLDFHDFFNSINNIIFTRYLDKIGIHYNEDDKWLINHIFFWNPNKKDNSHKKLILSVGAPSSPTISNAVMYFFDKEIEEYCESKSMKYSRYADDISISGNNKNELKTIIPVIREKLNELFNGRIILNELKTVIISPGYNKFITGITLTSQGSISIGRKRKRYIFSLVYKYKINELSKDLIPRLKGLLVFSRNIEPSFIVRLELKYGKEIIRRILDEK